MAIGYLVVLQRHLSEKILYPDFIRGAFDILIKRLSKLTKLYTARFDQRQNKKQNEFFARQVLYNWYLIQNRRNFGTAILLHKEVSRF